MDLVKKINAGLLLIAGIFLGISTFFATLNALLRYGLGSNFAWAEEFCTYLVVLLVFLVQPWLESTDNQLCISILNAKLKNETAKKFIFICRGLITIFIIALLVKYGIYVVKNTYATQAVTYVLQIPRYLLYAVTTGSFILVVAGWLAVILLNKGDKISC